MASRPASSITNAIFHFDIRREEAVSKMPAPHRHGEVEVNFLEAGGVTYLIGGRLQQIPPQRFCYFWASIPHRIVQKSDDARGFWFVTIPLSWVLSWEIPPVLLRNLFEGALLLDGKTRDADIAKLRDWQHALHTDVRYEKIAIFEMEARFRRFALDNPVSRATTTLPAGHVHGQIERLARFIVEHYQEPLRLADIATAVGLHPNYAATLFRQHCGQTLVQCLVQHRIAHAQRLLVTTSMKVVDIAIDSGFGSLSRFYEAFVISCSETPSTYRKRLAGLAT